jgi:purine catabolism regulator
VAAAEEAGLPLLAVPEHTAFIAVSKAVSGLLGAEEHEAITRAFEAQRDLTRAALASEGSADAVAARLARHLGGWVLVLDPGGRPVASAPASAPADELARRLAEPVASLRAKGLLASSSVGDRDGSVVLHPLGARGRVRGFLAVGTPHPLDRTAQSVVAVAVSLLSIAVEQPATGGGPEADAGLRAAAVSLLLAGAPAPTLPLAALELGWLGGQPVRVVVVRGRDPLPPPSGDDPAVDRVEVVSGRDRVVVVADRPDALESLEEAVAGRAAGGSGPATVDRLETARREAVQALAAASGGRLVWHAGLAGTGMLAALDPEVAPAVADALLAPLEGRKGDLVASLTAWLARHGQWDTAASDLGVHRHTLRYRMRRVEELLGRSLDDPDLRAELWLALRVRRPVGDPPPPGTGPGTAGVGADDAPPDQDGADT